MRTGMIAATRTLTSANYIDLSCQVLDAVRVCVGRPSTKNSIRSREQHKWLLDFPYPDARVRLEVQTTLTGTAPSKFILFKGMSIAGEWEFDGSNPGLSAQIARQVRKCLEQK